MKTAALVDEHRSAVRQMTREGVDALMRLGVPLTAIKLASPAPSTIILNRSGDLYQPVEDGIPAWIIPVRCADPRYLDTIEASDPLVAVATGPIVDLLAFWGEPRRWALRRGVATSLGAVSRQHDNADPVRVHRDVLSWLRHSCSGLFLLADGPFEAARILRQCRRILAEDASHAAELRRLINWTPLLAEEAAE